MTEETPIKEKWLSEQELTFETHPIGDSWENGLTLTDVESGDTIEITPGGIEYTSNEKLKELIEAWRRKYDDYDNDPSQIPNGGHQMMCHQINDCADELEALINE